MFWGVKRCKALCYLMTLLLKKQNKTNNKIPNPSVPKREPRRTDTKQGGLWVLGGRSSEGNDHIRKETPCRFINIFNNSTV